MSSVSTLNPTPTTVRGNTALLLADPDTVWTVRSGTVAVFAVSVKDGEPAGQRRYLFSCSSGDLLFGADASKTTGSRVFLVVGLEDSELASAPLAPNSALSNEELLDSDEQVASWVRRIGLGHCRARNACARGKGPSKWTNLAGGRTEYQATCRPRALDECMLGNDVFGRSTRHIDRP